MKRIINNYLYGLSNPNKISYLTFYVNNICQLRCSMCFYWDSMQKKTIQLSLDQIKKIAKSLPNLLQLSMTGGEPTLRKDLPEVVKTFCDVSKVAKCSIITNGMMTKRVIEMVKKILSENTDTSFRLCVSVDGLKEVHNKIRGVEKSYDNALKTFLPLVSILILDPIPSKTSKVSVFVNSQGLDLKAYGLLVKAPTGHKSITLPDNSESIVFSK